MKNELSEMFLKQAELQKVLNGANFKVVGNKKYITIMVLAAVDELMEALRETPWKPWKKQQTFNQENFKEELVDVAHFMINLILASGMTAEEFFTRYINKNKVNHKRKEEGY